MRVRVRRALWRVLAVLVLAPPFVVANVAPSDPRQELKKEVAAFFAQAGDDSIEAFGVLKKSPETLKAIQNQIDGMSAEDVAKLHEAMSAVPTPDAISAMLPPERREALRQAVPDSPDLARQAEQTRDDVLALTQLLKRVPDTKLRELGVDRAKVEEIESAFLKMSLLDLAAMHTQLAGNGEWQQQAEKAVGTLPPAVRSGAVALAKHGPITPQELASLEAFRGEIITRLQRVEALPENLRQKVNVENVGTRIAEVGTASPEVLFVMRQDLTAEELRQADETLTALERVAKITPKDVEELNRFRSELLAAYGPIQPEGVAKEARTKLEALEPQDLMLMQQRFGASPEMILAAPAIQKTLSAPGYAERVTALKQPAPDEALASGLEQFRADALRYIDAVDVEPALAARARQVVETAPLAKLDFIRAVNGNLPEQTSARTRLQIVTNALDCGFWVAGVYIDLNWLCTPLLAAVDVVGAAVNIGIGTLKTLIDGTIAMITGNFETVFNDLYKIYTDSLAFYTSISTIVTSIWNTLTTVANAFATVATAAATEVGKAFTALMAVKFPGEDFSLQEVLDLALGENGIKAPIEMMWVTDGEWWSEILNKPVPVMTCPAPNTWTPFGQVGTREAAKQAEGIRYILDMMLDLIPSTELSLLPKYSFLCAVVEFRSLAVCLKQAGEDAAAAQQVAEHALIVTRSDQNKDLLAQQLNLSFTSVNGLISNNGTVLQSAINTASSTVQAAIGTLTAAVEQRATDGRDLNLRLQIELNLASKEPLAIFQLPRANGGYLEMVRDLVNQAINAMIAAGQPVGKASKYYNDGLTSMNLLRFKEAYANFQSAYIDLTMAK